MSSIQSNYSTKLGVNDAKYPESKDKNDWEQRKQLIIRVNPRISELFKNVDYDYSQMLMELGNFQDFGDSPSMTKETFFQQNYDKILVHFFQYLFDFELQILQFKEKHQTILSFCEWVENQVSFSKPSTITLLKKKKIESKIRLEKQNQSQIKSSDQQKISTSKKRSINQISQNKDFQQIVENISSPKKKKIIENELSAICFIDFSSKYDDTTNNTASDATPKQNQANDQHADSKKQKKCAHQNQQAQNISKRKFFKVSSQKNEVGNQAGKNNKKQSYSLKSVYKQKKSQQNYQPARKKWAKQAGKIKVNQISNTQKNQDKQQLIQCETPNILKKNFSEPQFLEKKGQAKNDPFCLNQLQISGLQLFQDQNQIKSTVSRVGSITSQDQLIFLEGQTPKQIKSQDAKKQQKLNLFDNQQFNLSNKKINIRSIIQQRSLSERQKISRKIQSKSIPNRTKIQDFDRQAKILKARLSGVFRYSQKRFYIFPDMEPKPYFENCKGEEDDEKKKRKPREKSLTKKQQIINDTNSK